MNKKNIILRLLYLPFLCTVSFAEEKQKPNVVFIIVDDLNDWIGVMGGHPQSKTPNLDALAEAGCLVHQCSLQCAPVRTFAGKSFEWSLSQEYGQVFQQSQKDAFLW